MAMKKKGQVALLGIMIAFLIFTVAVLFITPIKDVTIYAREQMDCTNTSISTGTKLTCIVTDLYLFYFFGVAMAVSLSYLIMKKYAGDNQY